MRASGVGAQPAHTAPLPANRARLSATAERRWTNLTTPVGCLTTALVSNRGPVGTYNLVVRRGLATVMLAVFALLNAMDGICCADGCTREQESASQHHNRESTDGICVLCLGAVDSAAPQAPSPSGIITNRVGLPPLISHLNPVADPPEHPPRS
jgi:hypothetical protein